MHSHSMKLRIALAICGLFLPSAGLPDDRVSFTLTDGRTVEPLDSFRECDQCPEMIVMPPGSFMMGAIEGESRNPRDVHRENATGRVRGPDEINIIPFEHPRHPVEMDIPFAVARNEVTHHEWMTCVADGGCSHVPDHSVAAPNRNTPLGPNHPVINVSYLDALEYADWLNAKLGNDVYRLPTEAEWEYAARAGTETRFAQGDDLTADQANFSRHVTERLRGVEMPLLVNRRIPVPVDDLDAANAWGLRHMSGNVYEWTQSCWSAEHLGLSTASAYLAIGDSQNPCNRVSKGGSFNAAMDNLRPASRHGPFETRRRDNLGFRLMREFRGAVGG